MQFVIFWVFFRGEVDVQPDQLQSFLSTAELLKIKGLAEQNLCKESSCSQDDSSGSASPTAAKDEAAAAAVTTPAAEKAEKKTTLTCSQQV